MDWTGYCFNRAAMADLGELPRGKLENPSLSNPSLRLHGLREEGEVSSGGEDEVLFFTFFCSSFPVIR